MKIYTLGPPYSYSHLLTSKVYPSTKTTLTNTIEEVFTKVSKDKTAKGLVPIENMINGSVRETLFALEKYPIKITKAYNLPIHHCIASKTSSYNKIISHPQAIAQCTEFLKPLRKCIEIHETVSTSKAMILASQDSTFAAIGSVEAAKHKDLTIHKNQIEDNDNNKTQFIEIAQSIEPTSAKNVKTSLMIIPKEDRPGLLFEILAVFKIKNINLSKIESIPTGDKLGTYVFFIDIDANAHDTAVKKAFEFLESIVQLKNFGSYELMNLE